MLITLSCPLRQEAITGWSQNQSLVASQALSIEIRELREKGAITLVPTGHQDQDYHSHFFLVHKKGLVRRDASPTPSLSELPHCEGTVQNTHQLLTAETNL